MTGGDTTIDPVTLWIVIIGLGLGSFLLRFVFIGLVGSRAMPAWLLRHLRYTAVAMLPALVTPPAATDGELDLPRLASAMVALVLGLITKNVLISITGGAVTLYALLYLLA